jgi:hypothetical protein
MNSKLEMLTEKLQMLMYSCVSIEYKLSWLKMWNKSIVFKEAKKIPQVWVFLLQFDKWLHKITFWHQVLYLWMKLFF